MTQKDDEKPVVDPLANVSALTEPERGVLEVLAERTRWLSFAAFAVAGLGLVVSLVSVTGRVELGVVLYLIPTAIANAALGIFLKGASRSLSQAAENKLRDRTELYGGLQPFSKAMMIQLFATGFLVALLVAALVVAATVHRVNDI